MKPNTKIVQGYFQLLNLRCYILRKQKDKDRKEKAFDCYETRLPLIHDCSLLHNGVKRFCFDIITARIISRFSLENQDKFLWLLGKIVFLTHLEDSEKQTMRLLFALLPLRYKLRMNKSKYIKHLSNNPYQIKIIEYDFNSDGLELDQVREDFRKLLFLNSDPNFYYHPLIG